MGKISKREKWYHLMQDYEQSGKRVGDWCAEVGCTYHMFKYWRYRIRIQETYHSEGSGQPVEWLKADIPSVPQSDGINIRIKENIEIMVPQGFDQALLRDVVETLL
jgi:hypothetical protein